MRFVVQRELVSRRADDHGAARLAADDDSGGVDVVLVGVSDNVLDSGEEILGARGDLMLRRQSVIDVEDGARIVKGAAIIEGLLLSGGAKDPATAMSNDESSLLARYLGVLRHEDVNGRIFADRELEL